MMGKRWDFMKCFVLCLLVLSMVASASVTDPNIIAGVVRYNPDDNSGDTTPTVVKGGLFPGALPFVDRTYPFGDDANDLGGLDYVKTCVDDKDNPNHELDVTVNKAGTLYLIIDNRVGDDNADDPPTLGGGIMDWVDANGFTDTGYNINISTPGQVYALPLAGAGTTKLYEQNNGGSRVMYAVAAAPAGWNLRPQVTGVPSSAQVNIGDTLVIDSTTVDDGVPGTGISYQWTTLSAPGGATVGYSPNDTSEDVEVSFSELGDYTLQFTTDDGDKVNTKTIQVSVVIPTFAVECSNWVEACNDDNRGPSSHYRPTTYMYVRNHSAPRRRIQLISYDISSLKQTGEVFANTYLTMRRRAGSTSEVLSVYGIKEDLDNFDLNTGSWSNLPGVQNTPVPSMSDPITLASLDLADLSELLLEQTNIPAGSAWSDTATSAALDEFLNADDDGTVLLLFVTFSPEDADFEIYARDRGDPEPETGLGGIIIRGNVMTPTWATQPVPAINTSQSTGLAQLSWTNPSGVGNLTCDVWIGQGEPNDVIGSGDGFVQIADDTTSTTASLSSYTLVVNNEYNWIVNVTDDGTGETTEGYLWTFNTNNAYPTVEMEYGYQYLWLNNDGDLNSATAVINATASDDGFPNPTLNLLWEQISGPANVTIDPNNIEDITLTLSATGTYVFRLSADDGDLTGTSSTEIFVGATPCDAAKAKPEYIQIIPDFDNNCYVDLIDFSTFALHWLECNSAMDASCAP